MKKNALRLYIVLGILLILLSVIAFAVPFVKNGSFWFGYIFGVIAIVIQAYVFKVAFADGKDVKSKFYGFPIAKIGVVYLVAQLILSIIEMAAALVLPVWIPAILNVIALAASAIGFIAADLMKDEIIRQDVQLKKDVNNMRSLQSLSASLVGMCQDSEIKSMLQDLADDFKYSDPVSSDDTLEKENELKFLVNEIQRALVDSDMESTKKFCLRAKSELAERNRICKLGK